jgi:lambda family phage portal protein
MSATSHPQRRTLPTQRGLQLQASVLDDWRRHHGPETLRANRERGLAQAGGWGKARRSYAGASVGRTTADWVTLSTSADSEVWGSLRSLRNRSRQLCRDNEHAKQGLRVIMNNVVGVGIGFQSEVMKRGGRLNEQVNDALEASFARWSRARRCHTAGKLSFKQIQRLVISGCVQGGEMLVRLVKRRFSDSRVPLALEIIEPDQLADNVSFRHNNGNEVRMGVEVDEWLRPVAYWLYPRHPGDNFTTGVPQTNEYQRVPASEIIHIARWDERTNQTRGVPGFHAAMVKLRHIAGAEEAEIVRARASAAVMGFIESDESDLGDVDGSSGVEDDEYEGERVWDMAPGTIRELGPGEKFSGFNPSTANAALDPFLRYMLRSAAAGVGMSYESFSRDYSQSNYSSSRLALLDDRDNWRVLQAWFIESFLQEVFEVWLDQAVLCGELNLASYESYPEVYQAVRWMPRGWDWVDPMKEVAAAKAAVRAGFTTVADVVAAKGGDWEDVFRQRRREIDMAKDLDLTLETDPGLVSDKGQPQAQTSAQPTPPDDEPGSTSPSDDDGEKEEGQPEKDDE